MKRIQMVNQFPIVNKRTSSNSRVIELLRFMRPLSGNGANLSLGLVTEAAEDIEEVSSLPVVDKASSLLLSFEKVEEE
jgi:hypothetical protein